MRSTKLYAGINYDFRPESYWIAARNPLEAALRNVKGRNRREMIRDYNQSNLEWGTDVETLRDFTRGGADYYSDLSAPYAKAVEEMYETCFAETPQGSSSFSDL